ncbi:MAG: hypothetical protein AAF197_10175, partial [Pseudomonadota bacterium]
GAKTILTVTNETGDSLTLEPQTSEFADRYVAEINALKSLLTRRRAMFHVKSLLLGTALGVTLIIGYALWVVPLHLQQQAELAQSFAELPTSSPGKPTEQFNSKSVNGEAETWQP